MKYIDIKNKQTRLKQLKENVLRYENERHQFIQKKNEASRPELKKQSLKQLIKYELEIFQNTKKMENYLLLDSMISQLEKDKVGLSKSIRAEENNRDVYEQTKKNIIKDMKKVCDDLENAFVYYYNIYILIFILNIEKSTTTK